MNVNSASSSSSGPLARQRKERGAIAAQACDICRSRKQKCDESRPKCGSCQRMKLECSYREPRSTEKDKTLVEILDRLKSLETKVDRLPTSQSFVPNGFGPVQPSPSQPSFSGNVDDPATFSSTHRAVRLYMQAPVVPRRLTGHTVMPLPLTKFLHGLPYNSSCYRLSHRILGT